MGIAVGGFRIEFTVNGVALFVETLRGESSADIARRTADEINSELQNANALSVGPQVFTNGMLANLLSLDPGISLSGGLPVPTVSGWGLVLLALMLCSVWFAYAPRDGPAPHSQTGA